MPGEDPSGFGLRDFAPPAVLFDDLGMILLRRVCLFAIWTLCLATSHTVLAEDSPVKSATLERVGFDGKFKVGQWTPLVVRVETERACRAELQVEAADPDGNRTVWVDEFAVDSAGTHRLAMLFQAGRLNVALRPRVVATTGSEEGQQWTVPVAAGEGSAAGLSQIALKHAVLLVGSFGDPGGLADDEDAQTETKQEQLPATLVPVQVAVIKDPSEFAVTHEEGQEAAFTNATGLEALDTLVISGRYEMSEAQSNAIQTWVSLGGHLILSVGQELESYQASPLAEWISGEDQSEVLRPFRITGTTSFLKLDALEGFAGRNAASIEIDRQRPVLGVKIELGQNAESKLDVLSGPLIVRSPYGMGTITFVGLSLSEEPIRSWSSLSQAIRKLLWDTRQPTGSRSDSANNQLAYSGIGEFATQLHTALVTFPTVNRLTTWTIIGLMAAYLLVVGPLDYLLVHQLLGRPRFTWFTLPLLVILTSVLCVWMARSQNGATLMTSQVDVLDYDVSTKTLRSRSWVSLYSPETRRYQVALDARPLQKNASPSASATETAPSVRMSWFGVPETSFGGMYREGGQQILPPRYRFAPEARRIENLPIPIWGAKAVAGEWFQRGPVWVESDLESPSLGQLRGSIRHNFPVPITDWFVAYNNWVFLPRTNLTTGQADPLVPNASWPPNDPTWERVSRRELGGYLTRAVAKQFLREDDMRKKVQAIRMEQEPYNPLAQDNPDPLGEIVRMLTFHRQVGGKQYTGLDNHALRDMDLSGRLGLNQAVLFGHLDLSPTQLQIPDHEPQQNQRATLIRIVLPVEEKHAEESLPFNRDD